MKSVLEQYDRHVKPAFDYYIAPSMSHADIIVPRGGENEVAINLIVHHVQSQVMYNYMCSWSSSISPFAFVNIRSAAVCLLISAGCTGF